MKRCKRFGEIVATCITPATKKELERIAYERVIPLSELTRLYIQEGIARDGIER